MAKKHFGESKGNILRLPSQVMIMLRLEDNDFDEARDTKGEQTEEMMSEMELDQNRRPKKRKELHKKCTQTWLFNVRPFMAVSDLRFKGANKELFTMQILECLLL